MRKFDQESVEIAIELQQLLADFARDLDANSCLGIADFDSEDGHGAIGDFVHESCPPTRMDSQAKESVRARGHNFVNVRIHVEDANNAVAYFTNVSYANGAQSSRRGAISASAITSCEMTLQRDLRGHWRIQEFAGTPISVGDDPLKRVSQLSS